MPTDPTPEHGTVIDLHKTHDVDVVQFSFGTDNNYSDPPRNEDSRSTEPAVVDYSGGNKLQAADGIARQRTVTVTVKSSVTVTETPPETEFEFDGDTYRTLFITDQRTGVLEVLAERLDTD